MTIFTKKEIEPTSVQSRYRFWLIGLAGVGLVASLGYQGWRYSISHEQTDDAVLIAHLHPVSARINGTVREVLVEDNQWVKAGQPLIQLDPRDAQIQVQQAKSSLVVSQQQVGTSLATIGYNKSKTIALITQARGAFLANQAAVTQSEAALLETEAGVPIAQASLSQAQANLEKAQLDYKRFNQLQNDGAVSQQQVDLARNSYQVALAAHKGAVQEVTRAQSRVAQARLSIANAQAKLLASQGGLEDAKTSALQTEVSRTQYLSSNASVQQAQVALKDAQLQYSYTTITAPTSGRVGHKSVEVGQRVNPGQTLLSVVEQKPWVVANFKETQLARLQLGQSVVIKVDAFTNNPLKGHIKGISPASGAQFALLPPDNATGNFTKIVQRVPVKITLDPESIQAASAVFVPGMSVVVVVQITEDK